MKPWVTVGDYDPAVGEIIPAIARAFRDREVAIAAPPRKKS